MAEEEKVYVSNATNPLKKVMMCSPRYYQFNGINVITAEWMKKGDQEKNDVMVAEWQMLVAFAVIDVVADKNHRFGRYSRFRRNLPKDGQFLCNAVGQKIDAQFPSSQLRHGGKTSADPGDLAARFAKQRHAHSILNVEALEFVPRRVDENAAVRQRSVDIHGQKTEHQSSDLPALLAGQGQKPLFLSPSLKKRRISSTSADFASCFSSSARASRMGNPEW